MIVLGCTHYPLIKKQIKKAIGKEVIFLEVALPVAKRVKELLTQNNIETTKTTKGSLSFYLTDRNTEKSILKYLNTL